jgi:hypothetical protein
MNKDLANRTDEQLVEHYRIHGRAEGRIANELMNRNQFASLITSEIKALEIGPFTTPLLHGDNIQYCDILNTEELKKRAKNIGLCPDTIPYIHHVVGVLGLDEFVGEYDVLSSHCVEHQPDLISHFQQVERKLKNGGHYLLLIPDKRYCFDRYIPLTTIAEVIQAHEDKRSVHILRSIIEHRSMTVHNDASIHWRDNHTEKPAINLENLKSAIDEWRASEGKYIDVHAWYFTPSTFTEIIELLNQLSFTRLKVETVYSTRFESNEFWAILKKN